MPHPAAASKTVCRWLPLSPVARRPLPIPADPTLYRAQWHGATNRLRSVLRRWTAGCAVSNEGLGIAGAALDTDVAPPGGHIPWGGDNRRSGADPWDDANPHGHEARLVAELMRCLPPDWEPQVGVARDRLAARCAASSARPGHARRVPDAPEPRRRFLAPLSVNLLPVAIRTIAELHDRGIHRLGQLDDLSPAGLERISALTQPAQGEQPTQPAHGELVEPCARVGPSFDRLRTSGRE